VVGGCALDQLWLFWAAPLAGGVLAGLFHPMLQRSASNKNNSLRRAGRIDGALDKQPL
jgi:aquaporin Z